MILGFDADEFKKSTGVIFVALLIAGFVPIIGMVRWIPFFKEIVLGAAVIVVFTELTDTKQAVKFALATGMIAAVAFNVIYIPGSFLLGGIFGSAGGAEEAGVTAVLSGLGAMANLIGLVFMSPIGYIIGGAIGSVLND